MFGWKFSAWGPPQFYQIETAAKGESQPVRGALQGRRSLVPGKPTIGFECTIAVDSVDSIDETAKRVHQAGGTVALPKSIIVGAGALMFFQDTEGNIFGAMQFDPRAE